MGNQTLFAVNVRYENCSFDITYITYDVTKLIHIRVLYEWGSGYGE